MEYYDEYNPNEASNFDIEVTDLSPAFNFEEFTKEFENE